MALRERGIWDIWGMIVSNIEALATHNCYERLNILASLGFVGRFRSIAASLLPCPGIVMDAGCGPGTSTLEVVKSCRESRIIALDPSLSMLRQVLDEPVCQAVSGRFEKLPLPDSSIDGIVAMFSFRDAIDYNIAVQEFSRVLKPGGVLVILDIFKPVSTLQRLLLKGYLYGVGMIGGLLTLCRSEGKAYASIVNTIDRMLTLEEAVSLIKRYFDRVEVYRGPFIAILYGEKLK